MCDQLQPRGKALQKDRIIRILLCLMYRSLTSCVQGSTSQGQEAEPKQPLVAPSLCIELLLL